MAVRILSDLDRWREVAYNAIPGQDGGEDLYECKAEAYALVVVGSMSIGMGDLNDGTAEEWLLRLRMVETIYGTFLQGPEGGVAATMDMLRPYFGTRTNVLSKESMTRFSTRMGKALAEETRRKIEREAREVKATV